MFEHITEPRNTWYDAGKTLTPPRLEDRHLDAGIGFTRDKLYHFQFRTKTTGKWLQCKRFKTADEALKEYNRLIESGVEPVL